MSSILQPYQDGVLLGTSAWTGALRKCQTSGIGDDVSLFDVCESSQLPVRRAVDPEMTEKDPSVGYQATYPQ